mmetsp:Transcript_18680/g.58668  ORF Transcript_18680/g.58668 Transcript_18680/m.58668 type:complete len:283 (-) Transcript_18680:178-1026(-)
MGGLAAGLAGLPAHVALWPVGGDEGDKQPLHLHDAAQARGGLRVGQLLGGPGDPTDCQERRDGQPHQPDLQGWGDAARAEEDAGCHLHSHEPQGDLLPWRGRRALLRRLGLRPRFRLGLELEGAQAQQPWQVGRHQEQGLEVPIGCHRPWPHGEGVQEAVRSAGFDGLQCEVDAGRASWRLLLQRLQARGGGAVGGPAPGKEHLRGVHLRCHARGGRRLREEGPGLCDAIREGQQALPLGQDEVVGCGEALEGYGARLAPRRAGLPEPGLRRSHPPAHGKQG